MISRSLSTAAIAAFVFLANAAVTFAAADPSKVGENVKGLTWENAKPIWFAILLITLIRTALTRKTGQGGGVLAALALAGILLYNPAGVGSFMQGVAEKIV